MFRGYIDESYNPHVFSLSCLLSTDKVWGEFSRAWRLTLNSLNRKLKAQGRQTISRYHAADSSNLKREFADWTTDEQRAFFGDILKIFRRYPIDTVALSIDLDEFHRIIPEAQTQAKPDFQTFLYGMTTKFLIERIADRRCSKDPNARIALVHDRSANDSVMFEAFSQQVNDPNFAFGHCFTTFVSTGWERCIPLQPTDLVAYENFKDSMRRVTPRDRRKSLEMLIDLDSFGGRSQVMDAKAITELRAGLLAAGAIASASEDKPGTDGTFPTK
ncbi:MAG: hypothetical protein WAQ52_16710 [Terriglobales bacterium]